MKILVTGGEGQVGSEFFCLANPNVIALSRQQCDITQPVSIMRAINQYGPDLIVNAAAYTAVDRAETDKEPAFLINCEAVKNLALACKASDIPLIHLSTDYVFDGEKKSPYIEDDKPNPQTVYGLSKLAGENALRETWDKHLIFRVSWVFGQYGHNFVKTILRLSKEQEQLRIVADQQGCPTSARSIADTILNVCKRMEKDTIEWGTYHYCNLPATNWFEFSENIVFEAKKSQDLKIKEIIPITTQEYLTHAKRPANSVLNCEKIQRVFGIMPVQWSHELKDLIPGLMT